MGGTDAPAAPLEPSRRSAAAPSAPSPASPPGRRPAPGLQPHAGKPAVGGDSDRPPNTRRAGAPSGPAPRSEGPRRPGPTRDPAIGPNVGRRFGAPVSIAQPRKGPMGWDPFESGWFTSERNLTRALRDRCRPCTAPRPGAAPTPDRRRGWRPVAATEPRGRSWRLGQINYGQINRVKSLLNLPWSNLP